MNSVQTRLLYVAPRYHTNQVPIMKGWNEHGCEVCFLAQFEGVSEVHDYVNFHRMEQSFISKALYRILEWKYNPDDAETKKVDAFIPKVKDICRQLKKFSPDLIILRERSITNAVVYFTCKLLGEKNVILYVQAPIYGDGKRIGWVKRYLRRFLFPRIVFSPVLYKGKNRGTDNKIPDGPSWFLPLVSEQPSEEGRVYCTDGVLKILDVGKYRDYKNHFLLVDALTIIPRRNDIKVTIIGQVSNSSEEDYFEKLKTYIKERQLEDVIEIKRNIPFYEMKNLYQQNDVLVLPSKNESAGMVILEAMGVGLCVASSIHCGLSSYLDEYGCGYTFDIDDPKGLAQVILQLADHKETVRVTGHKAKDVVRERFCFESYVGNLNELTKREFNYTIQLKW